MQQREVKSLIESIKSQTEQLKVFFELYQETILY